MSTALNQGNSDRVIDLARSLEQTKHLSVRLANVEVEISELELALRNGNSIVPHRIVTNPRRESGGITTAREQAAQERARLERDLSHHGLQVHREGRSEMIYTLPSGDKMAVMFANEKRPDRWFFGTPVDEYGSLVFICRQPSGEIHRFFIPKEMIRQYRQRFGSSEHGDYKFNVFYRRGHYELAIPGEDRIDLTSFKENYNALR